MIQISFIVALVFIQMASEMMGSTTLGPLSNTVLICQMFPGILLFT